jgi:hypothetical protein
MKIKYQRLIDNMSGIISHATIILGAHKDATKIRGDLRTFRDTVTFFGSMDNVKRVLAESDAFDEYILRYIPKELLDKKTE